MRFIPSNKLHLIALPPNSRNCTKLLPLTSPDLGQLTVCLQTAIIVPCDSVLLSIYMHLNNRRKSFKKRVREAFNCLPFFLVLFCIRPYNLQVIDRQTNNVIPILLLYFLFSSDLHNTYSYCGTSFPFTDFYSLNWEDKWIMWR